MPLYEFECKKCNRVYEAQMSYEDAKEGIECPECKEKAEKIVSLVTRMKANWGQWAAMD